MTKEQFDAIRARLAAFTVQINDVSDLLAEVERLQTDVDLLKSLKHGWKVLTEKAIEEANTAYQRGAAAMREAAAKECWKASDVLADIPDMTEQQGELQILARRIRALPDPKDK